MNSWGYTSQVFPDVGEVMCGFTRDALCSALLILGHVLSVKRPSVLNHVSIGYPFYLRDPLP